MSYLGIDSCLWVWRTFLNLNGVRRKEPILAIIYDRGCVGMLLSG